MRKNVASVGLVAVVALVICAGFFFALATRGTRDTAVEQVKSAPAVLQAQEIVVKRNAQARGHDAGVVRAEMPSTMEVDYVEAFAKFSDETWQWYRKLAAGTFSEMDWPRVAAFLKEHRAELELINRLAAGGKPWYELDFTHPLSLQLKHLSPLRQSSILLALQCAYDRHLGRTDKVLEGIQAIFRLGGVLEQEPVYTSQMVRMAVYADALRQIERSLPPGELTAAQARQLIEIVQGLDYRTNFAQSLYMEAATGIAVFDAIRAGTISAGEVCNVPEDDWQQRLLTRAYESDWAEPWRNLDEWAYLENMRRVAEASNQPYYEARGDLEEIEENIEELPFTRALTSTLTPSFIRALQTQAHGETLADLSYLGLSVEAYCAEHGEYPSTLEEAVPTGQLPVDPFTGEDYRYTRTPNGYTLYSLGPDAEDDGGRRLYDGPRGFLEGDIAWREGTQKALSVPTPSDRSKTKLALSLE